jgi:hypothetical protein
MLANLYSHGWCKDGKGARAEGGGNETQNREVDAYSQPRNMFKPRNTCTVLTHEKPLTSTKIKGNIYRSIVFV